jgi:hypothetical protein
MNERPKFDPLAEFAKWFMSQPMLHVRPPMFGVHDFGDLLALTLYREGAFQVELFLIRPQGAGFSLHGEHRHPNVDSFEVGLCGEIYFSLNGKQLMADSVVETVQSDGGWALCGVPQRILPTDLHTARCGKDGGSFLSIQQWLNGVTPTSVGLDWEGPPHAENLKAVMREVTRPERPPDEPEAVRDQ